MIKNNSYKQTEIGEIPEDWNTVFIKEVVASANTGLDAIKRAPIVSYDTGIKCLRIQDVSQSKKFENWGFCTVANSNYDKFQLRKGDILVARTGASVGVNLIINEDLKAVFNNGLIRIRTNNKILPLFLFYDFQSQSFSHHIDSISQGTSTQPNIQINSLLKFEVFLPSLFEQQQIVSILSFLDDKIELNKKINKTLEEIGKALFKRWFVDFEFPNENGEPYKSNGGEMVDSEIGEIPKGWKVQNMGDVLELMYGKALREGERSEGLYPVYGSSGIVGNHNKFIVKAPGIVVGRKGNVGSIYWVDYDFYPIDTTYYVRTDQSMYLVYFALQRCNLTNSDSAVPGLSRDQAYMNPWLSPKETIMSKYDEVTKTIFDQKKMLSEEIQTLSQIRDSLLPRLMSGKLRV